MKDILSVIGIELSVVSFKEKLVSMVGGAIAIGILVGLTSRAVGAESAVFVVASMGASAVLLFAVPHGQLSQPWPLLGGNCISAAIGVFCASFFEYNWLAAGLAVGLSIGAMHQFKCIHPPGGATSLTAVIGGDAVRELGFHFVWWPVMSNAVIMLCIAVIINWSFKWRRYPAGLAKDRRSLRQHPSGTENSHEDIVNALRSLDSFIDVTETDLFALARQIAREREARILKTARKNGAHSQKSGE